MLVALQTVSGGKPAGRRMQLRLDQAIKVGRSGWADYQVEGDSSLMDVHFEVRCDAQGCLVRGLSQDAPTMLNGERIATAVAYDGDEIQAGSSKFLVSVQGGPPRPAEAEPEQEAEADDSPAADLAAGAAAAGLLGVCAYLDFGEEVTPLAEKAASEDELVSELTEQEKFQDAIKLRAYTLEKRQAVWWGCYCLREELDQPLPTAQTESVDAAANWVSDPGEPTRRAAEAKAAETHYSGAGSTLALSAFWSDGSLAPEGSPDVEPDDRLTAQGVTAALVTAAYLGDPTRANDRFREFLLRGKEVAEGKIVPPGDGAA